jgi:hypothetical protein
MSPPEETQHAIRRSTRLPLEIPVLVTSLNADPPFSAAGNTTLVNAHGCGLIVPRAMTKGFEVQLEIVSAKRYTTARVVEVVPLGGDPETWLVGLELNAPGNFWGIEYAPSDWKIEENSSQVAPQPQADHKSSAAAKPAHSRRWRLTDISAGACYLETAEPFAVDTTVLLSIRVSNTEWLLDGVVRVSHAQTGMGVEFTGVPAHDRRARVKELIDRLVGNREVPRIFVGRKEGQRLAPEPASIVLTDDESPDPLLELIRNGASLTVEQFLSDLRTQRLATSATPD